MKNKVVVSTATLPTIKLRSSLIKSPVALLPQLKTAGHTPLTGPLTGVGTKLYECQPVESPVVVAVTTLLPLGSEINRLHGEVVGL